MGENEINSYENQRARSKESENSLENLFFGIRSAELYFFRDCDPIYHDQILFDHDENPTTRFFLPRKLSPDGQSLIPLMGKNHALSEISWRYHTPTSELWYSYTVDRDNEEVNGFNVMRVVREFHASDDRRTLIPLLMECARLGYFDGNPNEDRISEWVSENRRRGLRPFFCRHDYSKEAFASLGINLANREMAEIDRSFRHYFENKKEIRRINVPTSMDKTAPISDFISIEDFKRLWSLSVLDAA